MSPTPEQSPAADPRPARPARPAFGPGPLRLVVDGREVAPLALADTPATRRKGLLGTSAVHGALWITKCPTVHMVGMRYPIDVAILTRAGVVLAVRTLRPMWGMTAPRWGASATLECAAGSLEQWGVRPGSQLSVAGLR